jgi:hypothetical protein
MAKTILYTEQLVAGALLKFDRVSSLDIFLLAKSFLKRNPDYELSDMKLDYLKDYVEVEEGKISLKNGLNLDSYVPQNESNLRKRLEQIAGACIRKYFQEFDIEEFMIRKIEHYSGIREDDMDSIFCKTQQEELKKLDEKGYLTTTWQDEAIYDDYRETRLSDFGKLRLFKIDNVEEIRRFIEILKSMRYDTSLLDDFLIKQDLDMPVWSVLDLVKLEEFCNCYDRAISEEGASSINLIRLQSDKKTILDEQGKKLMENMLSVWDNHCIHICHPNHLFAGAKPITADVREMVNINWDDIDVEKMLRINDYKTFITPDCSQAFKYAHQCLGHQIMNEVKKGNRNGAISYLVVVERYTFDYEDNYLVRGIIRGDYEGYSIAFNPEYQKTIPQSIWEKSLRMSDHEIPTAYLIKRKK